MKKTAIKVLAVVFSILLLGGSSAAKKGGSISGTIIEKCSKKPIPNINMQLTFLKPGNYIDKEVTTDKKGRYQFKNLEPGNYQLDIFPHPPYCYRFLEQNNNNEVIVIKKNEDIICKWILEIGGSLTGYVYKSPGVPFNDVVIYIKSYSGFSCLGRTYEDGSFLIESLCAPERYDIELVHNISGYSYKFLAGIYVEKGKCTQIEDFVFNFEDITGIEGYVTSSIDEKPLANASLSFFYIKKIPKFYFSSGEVYTDKSGYFYMKNLSAGKYSIYTWWPVDPPKRNPKTGKSFSSAGYVEMRNRKRYYVDVEQGKIGKIDIGIDIPSTIITEGVNQKTVKEES